MGPGADLPDLIIRCDGSPVRRALWGAPIPVDPGEHAIEASAPKKKPWRAVAKVLSDGDVQTVTLTRLEDATSTPAPTPSSASEPPTAPVPAVRMSEHHGLSTRRTIALVSTSVGLVGVGIGSYFGVLAIQRHGEAGGTCTALPCDSAVNSQAASAADASTASFAVALVGLALGAFLWLGDSSASSDKPTVSMPPSLGPGRGGIDLSGRF
jgi:hypothetical protein